MKTSPSILPAVLLLALLPFWAALASSQVDVYGPPGNEEFGRQVTMLPNGNFVVTDPSYDLPNPPMNDVGAVYLYSADGRLISTLTGGNTGDYIGSSGVQVLANGNFVVVSPNCDSGSGSDTGAVTWGSATIGFMDGPSTVVSSSNSLIGSSASDQVGSYLVTLLKNGHYVVRTPQWDGSATDVGAVTWCNGFTGTAGVVSGGNSLIGSSTEDMVGSSEITVLSNGNYVVCSPLWNDTSTDVGAVTWCNGNNGTPFGEGSPGTVVSSSNSLVGGSANDYVGSPGVSALTNGNYVVASSAWDNPTGPLNDVGAATWCDGGTGRTGIVTAANSLTGGTNLNFVASDGVTALANGNYVVRSSNWRNPLGVNNVGAVTWCDGWSGAPSGESSPGAVVSAGNSLIGTSMQDRVGSDDVLVLTNGNYVVITHDWDHPISSTPNVGAATWGSGTSGVTGGISATNSLIGTSANDSVGNYGGTALPNGNYVIRSREWDNGAAIEAGAVTWGNGTTGVTGAVSAANSLIGGKAGDNVGGGGVIALTNGHYVVVSPFWDSPASGKEDFGAVTWGNGTTGIKGLVSAANSLVGGTDSDRVGQREVIALTNGNYVVSSPNWDDSSGFAPDVGAVTWGSGSTGTKGLASAANSLIGSTTGDNVGSGGVTALANGHYVIRSPIWDNSSYIATNAGAVTWGSGITGIKGAVSTLNSLFGTTSDDFVGNSGVTALSNGNYVVFSDNWDNPASALTDSGAMTLCNGSGGTTGPVIKANSVLGASSNRGYDLTSAYDPAREQFIVGRPADNTVTRMGNLYRTLGKTGAAAPGALDISFGAPGMASIGQNAVVLADFALTGAGSSGGRNRALFSSLVSDGPPDLVMQLGDNISGLGGGLPSNARATALAGHVTHQTGRGLFFATISGTGITAGNNRLLLLDNGSSVSLLARTGQFIPSLGLPSTFREIVQSHEQDLLVLSYQLKASSVAPVVSSTSDTGLVPLTHGGTIINANMSAQEGRPAFGGSGVFGEFIGRAAVSRKNFVHFAAIVKNGPISLPGLFHMTDTGADPTGAAVAKTLAPGAGDALFSTFPAFTHTGDGFGAEEGRRSLFKATLTGAPATSNEGLWREGAGTYLVRKGVTEVLPGVKVTGILRFWPVGPAQIVFHAKLGGTGVTSANNEALILLQRDNAFLLLMRKGDSPDGIGAAKIQTITAVDVQPTFGTYAVLTSLAGSPSSSNQALWTGCTRFGNDTTRSFRRLPELRLRKGDHYSTESTPLGLVKSIVLKPAADATGAGGRGLAQAIGPFGEVVVYLIGAGNQVELVLLPAFAFPS